MVIFQNRRTNSFTFSTSKQIHAKGLFLKRLGKMLLEGFSLREALVFLSRVSKDESKHWVNEVQISVLEGQSLIDGLKRCDFPEQSVTQLYFALFHGDFPSALIQAGEHLIKQSEKKRKLAAILTYPVMLISFIIIMLFVMRTVLIPHIEQITTLNKAALPISTRLIVQMVYQTPLILLILSFLGIVIGLLVNSNVKKQSSLDNWNTACRVLPSGLIKLYWSQFIAYEWGQLLKGNCSLLEVVTIMTSQSSSTLLKDMGKHLDREMSKGYSFSQSMTGFYFLTSQMQDVIRHGEQSGKLGLELILFAKGCEDEFDSQVERLMSFIQPVVFASVAVMIIAIYAALLLPTFGMLDTL